MNLNIQINNELYKQQIMKSPRRLTPQNDEKHKQKDKSAQINQFKSFIRAYRKEVQLPINFQTSIFMNKAPQRCLQHNHIISLYCTLQKKPLCIHCVPQMASSKKHTFVPLNKANQRYLKEQLKNYVKNINSNIFPIMIHLIEKNSENIEKIQNSMPKTIQKINNFYDQVIQSLKNTKQEQIKRYVQFNEDLKVHYMNFGSQINKIKQIAEEKLKQLTQKVILDQNILYHHNMAMHLNKLGLILTPQFCQYKEIRQSQIQAKLQKLKKQINKMLIEDKVALNNKKKQQRKTSFSPKATKNRWNPLKKELLETKQYSLTKIQSNPKLNSGITPRESQNSKKKQFHFNLFQKNRLSKSKNREISKHQRKSLVDSLANLQK